MQTFDGAGPALRAERYGITQQTDGPDSRARAVEVLRNASSGYAAVEGIIRALLLGLFIAFLVLKAFQPDVISVYFSERLQSVYEQMLKGGYDHLLDGLQKVDIKKMTVLGFEEWYSTSFKAIHGAFERRKVLDQIAAEQKMQEDGITSVESRTGEEIEEMQQKLVLATDAALKLEREYQEQSNLVEQHQRELSDLEENIRSADDFVNAQLQSAGNAKRVLSIVRSQPSWEGEITRLKNELAKGRAQADDTNRRLTIAKTRRDTISKAVEATSLLMAKASNAVADSRADMIDAIRKQKPD